MSGYYNGGDDDGVSAAAWKMSHRLDDAREEFVESGEPFGVDSVGPVVQGLSAALEAVAQLPAPQVEVRELGWSARSRRRS